MTGIGDSSVFLAPLVDLFNQGKMSELDSKLDNKEARIAFEQWMTKQSPAVIENQGWRVLTSLTKYASQEEDFKLAKIATTLLKTLHGPITTECMEVSEQAFTKGLTSTSWVLMKNVDNPKACLKLELEKWRVNPTEKNVRWLNRLIQDPIMQGALVALLKESPVYLRDNLKQKILLSQASELGCTTLFNVLAAHYDSKGLSDHSTIPSVPTKEIIGLQLSFKEKVANFVKLVAFITFFPVTVPIYCLSEKTKTVINKLFDECKSGSRKIERINTSLIESASQKVHTLGNKTISKNDSFHIEETPQTPPVEPYKSSYTFTGLKKTYDMLPLMNAIESGDIEEVLIQLEKNGDIDRQNISGVTALVYAVYCDKTEIVELLLRKGADVNLKTTSGDSPILFAALNGNMRIMELLLKKGADVYFKDTEGLTVLNILKMKQPPGWQKMIQLIEKYSYYKCFSNLKNHAKMYTGAKLLSHACALRGTAVVEGQVIPLEGGFSNLFATKIAKSILEFSKAFPLHLDENSAVDLAEVLQFAAGNNSPEQTLKRIRQGMPTCILTGYDQHAATVFIWGDFFIWCDRSGEPGVNPISVCRFDPEKLRELDIQQMKDVKSKPSKEYIQMMTSLYVKLGVRQSEDDLEIQKCIDIPAQVVGNCGWASVEGALKAHLVLNRLKKCPSGVQQNEALKESVSETFTSYTVFQQIKFLDKYLDRGVVDRHLVFDSFNALWSLKITDLKLTKRIMELEDKYYATASKIDRQDYVTNKIMRSLFPYPNAWRNLARTRDVLTSIISWVA